MQTIRGDGDDEDRYDDMTGMVDKRQKQFIESIAYIALPHLPIRASPDTCSPVARCIPKLKLIKTL